MATVEDLLECAVCFQRMKEPKMLQCQHTYCKTCLEKVVERDSITCPECREEHCLGHGGVNGLPNNRTIAKLLDVPTKDKFTVKALCQDCKIKMIRAECRHCEKIVCRSCLEEHTRILNDQFHETASQAEKLLPAMSAAIPNSKKNHEVLENYAAAVTDEINMWHMKFSANLQRTLRDMLQKVEEFKKREIGPYKELEEYYASMQSISNTAKKQSKGVSNIHGTDASIQRMQSEMMDMLIKCKECVDREIVDDVEKSRKTLQVDKFHSEISSCITGLVFAHRIDFPSPPTYELLALKPEVSWKGQSKILRQYHRNWKNGEKKNNGWPFSVRDPD